MITVLQYIKDHYKKDSDQLFSMACAGREDDKKN